MITAHIDFKSLDCFLAINPILDLAAGNNDVSTLLCQQTRGFFSDTATGAAYQGNLAGCPHATTALTVLLYR